MSTDQPAGRLVFIGEDESIERLGAVEFARIVQRRYAAAPADPGRALEDAAEAYFLSVGGSTTEGATGALLAALGCPPSEHTRDAS